MVQTPNLDYIKQIADGNSEFEKKFFSIIQSEFPSEKNDYIRLLDLGQLEEASKIVHKMKQKLGILGLSNGYEMAIQYEKDLKEGNTSLKQEFEQVLQVAEAFIVKMT